MSGHSSFSFYCATFLVIYLQARLNKIPPTVSCLGTVATILKLIRPFVQFGVFILAFWIALTRISDYFHHPMDVTCGAIVGIGFAIITLTVADIFKKQTAFRKFAGEDLEKRMTQNHENKNKMEFVTNHYEFSTD